jgi:hypothetical protein
MAQYRTLREIAARMRWAPSTVLRRHKLDDFPIYPDWTAWGLIWVTSDELIQRWELKKVMMSHGARLKRPWKQRHKTSYRSYNYRLRDKYRTGNGTVRPSPEEESLRSLREGLAKLTPAEQAWIIEHELTLAQREELGVELPEIPRSKPAPSGPGAEGTVPLWRAEPVLGPQRVAARPGKPTTAVRGAAHAGTWHPGTTCQPKAGHGPS